MSKKNAAANPTLAAAIAADKAKKPTAAQAAFARAVEDWAQKDAHYQQDSKTTRDTLRDLAVKAFKAPLSVADAAVAIGLDLSVSGMDKEDVMGRLRIQRLRVTLQRALKDAELLVVNNAKGRKASASEDGDEPAAKDGAAVAEKNRVAAILAILPSLTDDELQAVLTAVDAAIDERIASLA